ncbi:HAAS signaling domain-containing protein [Anaerosalibacter sp. Marseille-P3206]|uniref:HAAS signaling domain-containing protein n=1 Tax=Anaerosalibacter sp. Marseille-P3206 TaxID=1871005 RepID=UPI001F3946C7|nr:DUF1700 domain-containing protein [Anaerosalibacter sp. Marseille-P3206]
MTKAEYIQSLRTYLKKLPPDELEDIIYDYEEHFQIGLSKEKTEEEIARELGDPRNIAKMYNVSSKIDEAEQNPSTKNILKAVFSAMALGIFNFIIVLGPFIAIVGLLIGLYGLSIGFVAGGISAIFGTMFVPFSSYQVTFGVNSITSISFGIGLTALGALFFIACIYFTKLLYKGTISYLKWNVDIIKK